MKIGFYPGCSLKGTSREYNESVAVLAKAFSLELEEVQDWNCCGATAAHSMNRTLALLLPARILALAEQQGLDEVVVPCASCYNRLSTVQYELAEDEALRNEIADTIRMPYTGSVRILNVVQMIEKYIQGELAARIVQPFDTRENFGDVTILYGAKSVGDLVYKHELDEWAARPDVRLVTTVDPGGETADWKGRVGFVPSVLEQIAPSSDNTIAIVCGPPVMIKFTFPVLEKLGFADDRIYTTLENRMKCGVGKCGRCNVGKLYVCKDGPVFTKAQLNGLPPEY